MHIADYFFRIIEAIRSIRRIPSLSTAWKRESKIVDMHYSSTLERDHEEIYTTVNIFIYQLREEKGCSTLHTERCCDDKDDVDGEYEKDA